MNKRIFPYTEFVGAYDRFRFNKWNTYLRTGVDRAAVSGL